MGINATVWKPTSGNGEYSSSSADNIVDPTDSSINLVDPSGVFIVSPDITLTPVAGTVWTDNQGL